MHSLTSVSIVEEKDFFLVSCLLREIAKSHRSQGNCLLFEFMSLFTVLWFSFQ
jgi:hypothetical protein